MIYLFSPMLIKYLQEGVNKITLPVKLKDEG